MAGLLPCGSLSQWFIGGQMKYLPALTQIDEISWGRLFSVHLCLDHNQCDMQSSMGNSGVSTVENHRFCQWLDHAAGGTSGHHFKLATPAELEQRNSKLHGGGIQGETKKMSE